MSSTTTLSTNIRGDPPSVALSDPMPLMLIAGALLIAPLENVMVRPGTTPCSPLAGSVKGLPSIVLATFTVATAPVRFSFLWEPNPTTTTSSSCIFSSRKTASTTPFPFISTLTGCIPTSENSSTPSSGASIIYCPSMSVMAILPCIPTTTTETPARGSPAISVTFPFTVIPSAQIPAGYPSSGTHRSSSTNAPPRSILDLKLFIRSPF